MRPFRFTLQAVRTLRQRQESQALERYAQALTEYREALGRLQQVRGQLNALCVEFSTLLPHGMTASHIEQFRDYLETGRQQESACELAVHDAERTSQQRLGEVLAARQEREIVDKFFQRQRDNYDRELRREEMKVLDDLARRKPMTAAPAELAAAGPWN